MNIRSLATGSAAIALSMALVAPVAAVSVDTSGAAGVNVNVAGQASSSSGSTGAGASGSVNGSASGSSSLKNSVTNLVKSIAGTASSGASVAADTSADANANTTASSDSSSNADSDVVFFTRGEIEAAIHASENADENASENAAMHRINIDFVGSPASVHSNADLSAYVATQMKADNGISEVQASTDNVTVTYKEKAKFLGFIPASLSATAVVDASGEVTVTRPWYSFLYSSVDNADLESKIQARVNAALGSDTVVGGNANASASAEASFTAAEQAKLVAEIRAAMEEEFNASVN